MNSYKIDANGVRLFSVQLVESTLTIDIWGGNATITDEGGKMWTTSSLTGTMQINVVDPDKALECERILNSWIDDNDLVSFNQIGEDQITLRNERSGVTIDGAAV